MIQFKLLEENQDRQWDEFVEGHPCGTLFHSSKWLKLLQARQNLKMIRLAVYLKGEMIGVFPLFLKGLWPVKVAASPFIVEDTPYMGPVVLPEYFWQTMKAFDSVMKELRISFVRIISRNIIPQDEITTPANYKCVSRHTHILDLSESEDAIWKKMEGRCRTAIKKAEKSGIEISQITERSWIEEYYNIYAQLYSRQEKVLPNSKEFFYALFDNFFPENLYLLAANYQGQTVAGAFFARHKDTVYYLDGASLKNFNHLAPNNLIQWTSIKKAKTEACKTYDFVGSDLPWIAKFKKSFGGSLCSYTCLEKSCGHWVAFLRDMYPVYKNIMGKIKKSQTA